MLDIIDFTYKMKHKLSQKDIKINSLENQEFQNIPHYKLLKKLKPFVKEEILEENKTLKKLKEENKIVSFTLKFLKDRENR
ncbi:MAG: hypothetical protein RR523_00790 [Cetobacterium sp.]|uniref:hypothetical protein n=1 Tax=Cetobacterium sp. TaxID=2071632 RepID=UPI002FCA5A71